MTPDPEDSGPGKDDLDRIRLGTLWLLPALALLVLLYWPGLHGPFLFDDAPNITDNVALAEPKHSLLDWWSAAQSSGAGALRRPVAMLSFALQFEDGAVSAFALKVVNLLLHCICGVLIATLGRLLLRESAEEASWQRWLPLAAACLWLFSPLLLSTVLYPVQRMAQGATLFVLAGLNCYACYRSQWAMRGARSDELIALPLWLLFFTAIAVLSKENGLLLPWLVVVIEATLFLGRWNGGFSQGVKTLGLIAFFLPLAAIALLLIWQWEWVIAGYSYREFDLRERLWTEGRLLWSYLSWFVLPQIHAMGLFHDDLLLSRAWTEPLTTLIAPLAWLGALAFAFRWRGRNPWLLMGLLFYLVGHSMESGFLALELVFEHRNYLPSVGLAFALASLLLMLGAAWNRDGLRPKTAFAPLLLSLLVSAGVLALRSQSWSNQMALATAGISRHPDSPRAAHFYANTLITQRTAPGTGEERAAQLLGLARHEFERLFLEDTRDLSALVMLYTLDVKFFPHLDDPDRWLPLIENSVSHRVLNATEYAAMRVLLACVVDGDCNIADARLNALLETFSARFAHVDRSAALRLFALEGTPAAPVEKVALLEDAIAASPAVPSLYYSLIAAWLEAGDYAAAHRAIVRLLAIDRDHRQLAGVDAIFRGREDGR